MEEHSSIEVTDLCVDFRTEASGFQYLKELITRRATGAQTKIPSHPRRRLQDQIRLDHRHRGTEWVWEVDARACSLASTPE